MVGNKFQPNKFKKTPRKLEWQRFSWMTSYKSVPFSKKMGVFQKTWVVLGTRQELQTSHVDDPAVTQLASVGGRSPITI